MNATIEKFEQYFDEIKASPAEAANFFRAIWTCAINLPKTETKALLDKAREWAAGYSAEYPGLLPLAIYSVGQVTLLSDKYEEAIMHLTASKDIFEEQGDRDGIAICQITLGNTYRALGDVELAIRHLLDGIPHLEKTGAHNFIYVVGCYNLGGIYAAAGNLELALKYYETAFHNTEIDYIKTYTLSGMGEVYMLQEKYDDAKKYYDRARQENGVDTENALAGRLLTDLANWYRATGNPAEALHHNELALALRLKQKLLSAAITNMVNIAIIYRTENNASAAVDMLGRALTLAESVKANPKLLDVHKGLSDVYDALGDTKNSYDHFRKFHEISMEVSKEDVKRKVKNLALVMEAEHTKKENAIIKEQKAEIQARHEELKVEKKRSDDLLLNILPVEVAEELKEKGFAEAKYFDHVTVLFTDFVGFTKVSELLTPQQLINELHLCFKAFDEIVGRYGIEKIKTIGDAYLAVCGLPVANARHAENVVMAAIEIRDFMLARRQQAGSSTFEIRIGIHTGNVVAGIVGIKKFAYDIWGDTVNTAARMEQNSEPGRINISQTTYEIVKDRVPCIYRGEIAAKNKGSLKMYFVS